EEITVVERQFVIVKHQHKKYRCAFVTREDAVAYTALESRSQQAARQVLGGNHEGSKRDTEVADLFHSLIRNREALPHQSETAAPVSPLGPRYLYCELHDRRRPSLPNRAAWLAVHDYPEGR